MKKTAFAFIVLVLAIMSCDPTAPETLPTQVPGSIETIIALTSDAANAMTQAALPTATHTPPATATATKTPLPPTETPTPTPTFFFALPTVTNTLSINVTPPPSGGGGGGGGTATPVGTCSIVSRSPSNGADVPIGKKLQVTWNVRNTSNFTWGATDYDLTFVEGDQIYTQKLYDLPRTTKQGDLVSLTVTLKMPNKVGYYKTVWRIKGDYLSCYMEITLHAVK